MLQRGLGAPRSRCDIPRRAPRHLGAGRRASGAGKLAWRGARGRGGAWGRPRWATLALRLRLGLCAAGSASLALQVPVTHKHSRPPLALAHSLPRRRRRRAGQTHQRAPTQRAENQPVWHQGTEGGAGGGEGRLGTRRTPHAAAQEAWVAYTHGHSSPGRPGGRQRQREPVRA